MSKAPKLTSYVSEIDQVLQGFDKKHPTLSSSQQKEKTKYDRIYKLRDVAETSIETPKLWEDF